MKKKILPLSMVTLVALSMVGCAAQEEPKTGAPVSDVTLTVSRWAGDSSEAQAKLMTEFTKETGIKVKLDAIDYAQLKQKQTLSLSGKTGQYDLLMVHHRWLEEYVNEDFLVPVGDLLEDKTLTGDDLDMADFAEGMIAGATIKDEFYGLPTNPAVPFFVYNTESLKSVGLKTPESWSDLLVAAEKFHDAGTGIALPSAQADSPVTIWSGMANANGGGIFDKKGNLALTSQANIDAMLYWQKLNKFAVQGSNNFNWQDVNTRLQLGDAPLGIALSGIAVQLEDPASSRVIGKLGYAPIPGPKAGKTFGTSSFYVWGVAANSKNSKEAFQLSAWLTSKEQLKRLNLDIYPEITARASISEIPAVSKKLPFLSAVSAALNPSGSLPTDVNGPKLIERLGSVISNVVVNSADPLAELTAVQSEFESLYKR